LRWGGTGGVVADYRWKVDGAGNESSSHGSLVEEFLSRDGGVKDGDSEARGQWSEDRRIRMDRVHFGWFHCLLEDIGLLGARRGG